MYRALLWLQSAQSIGVGIYLLIWLYRETRLQWDALCNLVSGADRVKCEAWMGMGFSAPGLGPGAGSGLRERESTCGGGGIGSRSAVWWEW